MRKLPHWVLPNRNPAFYDSESATAIEQTAKVYAAMNELIDNYNAFVDSVTSANETFQAELTGETNTFAVGLRQEFQDFIDIVELQVNAAESFMRENLQQSADIYLTDITNQLHYDMNSFAEDRAKFQQEFEQQNAAIKTQNTVLSNTINTLNQRLADQDGVLADAVNYMKTNLATTIDNAVETMIQNGEIVVGLGYDEGSESLTMAARNMGTPSDLAVTYDSETEGIHLREVALN